jgi:hypothetical protein
LRLRDPNTLQRATIQNVPLGAQIIAVAPGAPPWERVRVSIYQQIADMPASMADAQSADRCVTRKQAV